MAGWPSSSARALRSSPTSGWSSKNSASPSKSLFSSTRAPRDRRPRILLAHRPHGPSGRGRRRARAHRYKTGYRVTPKDLEPPRPDDPQLPLYALAAPEELSAVAYAKLRRARCASADFPGQRTSFPRWWRRRTGRRSLAEWSKEAESLGAAFAAATPRSIPSAT